MISSSKGWIRFAVATVVVVSTFLLVHALEWPGLHVHLTKAVHRLLQPLAPRAPQPHMGAPSEAAPSVGQVRPAQPGAVGVPVDAEGALRRSVAFRFGVDLGFLAVLRHASALKPSPELAAAEQQVMARVAQDAALLQVSPVVVMQGRDLNAQLRLVQRAEADESGMATRVVERGGVQLGNIFMMGMHTGMASFWVWALGSTTLDAYEPHIRAHARAAGIPEPLWKPLTQQPMGKPAEARATYHSQIARVVDGLAKP